MLVLVWSVCFTTLFKYEEISQFISKLHQLQNDALLEIRIVVAVDLAHSSIQVAR